MAYQIKRRIVELVKEDSDDAVALVRYVVNDSVKEHAEARGDFPYTDIDPSGIPQSGTDINALMTAIDAKITELEGL